MSEDVRCCGRRMNKDEYKERLAYRCKVEDLYNVLREKYDEVDSKTRYAINILMPALKVYHAYLEYEMRGFEAMVDCSSFVHATLHPQDTEDRIHKKLGWVDEIDKKSGSKKKSRKRRK